MALKCTDCKGTGGDFAEEGTWEDCQTCDGLGEVRQRYEVWNVDGADFAYAVDEFDALNAEDALEQFAAALAANPDAAYRESVGDLWEQKSCGCVYITSWHVDSLDDFALWQWDLHMPCEADDPERNGENDWLDYAGEYGHSYTAKLKAIDDGMTGGN